MFKQACGLKGLGSFSTAYLNSQACSSLSHLVLSSVLLQVCQFVVSVNGLNVLNLDYRTVSSLILTGPRTVVMEVMEEVEY